MKKVSVERGREVGGLFLCVGRDKGASQEDSRQPISMEMTREERNVITGATPPGSV